MSSLIELHHVTRHYQMGHHRIDALKEINLSIEQGECVAIIGPSGSGKSTLMNVIGLLDTPSSGKYLLDEEDVSTFSTDKLATLRNHLIGFVFQAFFLLPRLNALQNVCLPLIYQNIRQKQAQKIALSLLERVGMADRAYHKPNELSGGQQQRVAIARALVCDPKILLADEPTGALDSKTGQEIIDLFIQLNRDHNKTVILITHDQAIAEKTDRIIHIYDGLLS